MGGSGDEAQSPQRRKHCASHTEPGCRMSPGVPPAPPHRPTLPPPRDRDQAHCEQTLPTQDGRRRPGGLWTLALPSASFTNHSVMHSNTRPSARSWGPTDE